MKALASALAALALAAALPAAASPSTNDPAEAVWDLDAAKAALETVDAFHAAMDRGDAAAATALLGDELSVFEGGHVERTRAEYLQGHLPADIEFSRQVKSEVTASSVRASADVAVVTQETRTRGAYNGKPVDSFGAETMILHRTPGGWRIIHIHWSSRKAPAA